MTPRKLIPPLMSELANVWRSRWDLSGSASWMPASSWLAMEETARSLADAIAAPRVDLDAFVGFLQGYGALVSPPPRLYEQRWHSLPPTSKTS